MKHVDWDNVEEAADFPKVTPGGYVCRIVKVEDVAEKEYLIIYYDIAEGKFANYYKNLSDKLDFWGGKCYRSYKKAAEGFFKGFITATEKSNQGFIWGNCNDDEQKFVGKLIGVVLSEEEYKNNKGEKKDSLYVSDVRSTTSIRSNDYKVKEKKLIEEAFFNNSFGGEEVPLDEPPF